MAYKTTTDYAAELRAGTAAIVERHADRGDGAEARANAHCAELNAAVAAGELPAHYRYEVALQDGLRRPVRRYFVVVRREDSLALAFPKTIALPDGKVATRVDDA